MPWIVLFVVIVAVANVVGKDRAESKCYNQDGTPTTESWNAGTEWKVTCKKPQK